jgi:toxin ParE1/3/4
MIAGVIFSPESLSDIRQTMIWFQDNADSLRAERFLEGVRNTILSIIEMPGRGPLRDFDRVELQGMRSLAVEGFSKHFVFYKVEAEQVQIVRVLDGRRDLASLF